VSHNFCLLDFDFVEILITFVKFEGA